jgi:hypothetical protein
MHPLERIAALELERDALRERLASFERGEPDAAYRAELKGLEETRDALRAETEELRRRIREVRRRRRFGLPMVDLEGALRELWRAISGR